MKKITAFLGFVGVVSMFAACSDSGTSVDEDLNDQAQLASSSSAASKNSSSSKKETGDDIKSSGSNTVVHDTITQQVIIRSSGSAHELEYYSSGVFCWDDSDCKPSEPAVSSSSYSIEVTMSSEAQILPVVTEKQMVDQRDQKSYALETIGGVHWMTQNLDYRIEGGSFCPEKEGEDMCAKYGSYYTASAAKRACPSGWRLPTPEEIQAADAAVDEEWWTLGGRAKYSDDEGNLKQTEYGLDEQQGYWWLSSGTSWRVQPSSSEHVEQGTSSAEGRAYSVRCVENK